MSVDERDWFRGSRKEEPAKLHAPVCGNCGEDWPCRHERIERKARAYDDAARRHHGANARLNFEGT